MKGAEATTFEVSTVRLARGACMGRCPVYDVTLAADGSAAWHGIRFVERIGSFTGTVELHSFNRVTAALTSSDYFSWEAFYPGEATCMPSLTMEVGTPTRRFSVAGEGDSGPADLHKIADLIDAVSRSIRWSRASDRLEDAHQSLAADPTILL